MPAVASAASWLEAFHLPMREIRKRYTRSEMAIMAWRSREIGYNMSLNRKQSPTGPANVEKPAFTGLPPVLPTAAEQALEEKLGPLAVKLGEIENTGEVTTARGTRRVDGMDMRKLTGDEAMAFMSSMGINIGGRE